MPMITPSTVVTSAARMTAGTSGMPIRVAKALSEKPAAPANVICAREI